MKNNFISKTRNNTYEPIVGSQSKIQINNKYIEIGNRRSNNYYKEKIKLLVSVNDLDKLHLPKKINQTLSFFQLKKAKLTVSEKNILHLKISFKGEKYEYFKSVWTFLNPELK